MTSHPQLATQLLPFEVFVNGSGPDYGQALSPDFADLDGPLLLNEDVATGLTYENGVIARNDLPGTGITFRGAKFICHPPEN